MPFYKCITLAGTFAQAQKEEIVGEITRIHCEATGGLPANRRGCSPKGTTLPASTAAFR